MAVLLLADVAGGALSVDQTAKALTAVKDLGPVTILVCGPAEAAKLEGAAKVLHAGDALYGAMLAEPSAGLVASLAGDYEHIAAPSTANGKNILPRVAALLDVMVISDITAVKGADAFERPIYAGNAIQVVRTADAKKVFTIRTAGFGAAGMGGSAPVEAISAAADPALSAFVEDKVQASDRPERIYREEAEATRQTTRELGISYMAYAPLGRSMLTGGYGNVTSLPDDSPHKRHPRFADENLKKNLELIRPVEAMAKAKGCTPAQIALAWVLAQGDDVVAIPGTKSIERMQQNIDALDVELSADEVASLADAIPAGAASGTRYPAGAMKAVQQ